MFFDLFLKNWTHLKIYILLLNIEIAILLREWGPCVCGTLLLQIHEYKSLDDHNYVWTS